MSERYLLQWLYMACPSQRASRAHTARLVLYLRDRSGTLLPIYQSYHRFLLLKAPRKPPFRAPSSIIARQGGNRCPCLFHDSTPRAFVCRPSRDLSVTQIHLHSNPQRSTNLATVTYSRKHSESLPFSNPQLNNRAAGRKLVFLSVARSNPWNFRVPPVPRFVQNPYIS